MRGRVIAAFVVGFAIGGLVIGVGMWSTGRLQSSTLPPWMQRVPATPPADAVPDLNAAAKLPATPVPPPEGMPPAPPDTGSADRAAPEPPATMKPATTAATTTSTDAPLHL